VDFFLEAKKYTNRNRFQFKSIIVSPPPAIKHGKRQALVKEGLRREIM